MEPQQGDIPNESYIRNVNEYEEYEPIINETHKDFDADYEAYHNEDFDQALREQNTKKIFKKGMSPILLIVIAGAAGVLVYGF